MGKMKPKSVRIMFKGMKDTLTPANSDKKQCLSRDKKRLTNERRELHDSDPTGQNMDQRPTFSPVGSSLYRQL